MKTNSIEVEIEDTKTEATVATAEVAETDPKVKRVPVEIQW